MLIILVLAVSAFLQFIAAFFAFRLIKDTGKAHSWILISVALCIIGFRRLIPLFYLIFIPDAYTSDLGYEIIGLILSLLLFFGMMGIRPLLTERKRVEEKIFKLNEELEQKVIERTAGLEAINKKLVTEISGHKEVQEKLLHRNRELSVLYTINRATAKSLDLEETLHNSFEATLQALNIEAGGIYLLDKSSGTMMLHVYKGHSEEFIQSIKKLNIGEGISGKAVLEKRTIVFDVSEYPSEKIAPLIVLEGFKTMAAIPLLSAGEAVGALNLGTRRVRAFQDEEIELLTAIGQQLGSAVQNAKLYESIQHELTERIQAEEALQQRTTQLEVANKELDAFSYSVSHDLRAPLRAIDGFSKVLLDNYSARLDDDAQRYLNIIRNNTQQMGELIDDLLSFSRLGKQEMRLSQINMEQLVLDAFNQIKILCPNRVINFKVESLPSAFGDIAMLKIVLTNLISNAVKFTGLRNEAAIVFGGSTNNRENTYFIKDNGAGFDMKYSHKLFGVFQRLHSKDEYEGTGVGLALVQRIIHRHGGRVWGEGKINEGAVFYFTLRLIGGEA